MCSRNCMCVMELVCWDLRGQRSGNAKCEQEAGWLQGKHRPDTLSLPPLLSLLFFLSYSTAWSAKTGLENLPIIPCQQINSYSTLSFSKQCILSNLAVDFLFVNRMNLAQIFHLFCPHILPVCKWPLYQICFLYFNMAIKTVMDVPRAIAASLLRPGKISPHLVLQLWGVRTCFAWTHFPLTCLVSDTIKSPLQTYIRLTNNPWIALHRFVVPSSLLPLTSPPPSFLASG